MVHVHVAVVHVHVAVVHVHVVHAHVHTDDTACAHRLTPPLFTCTHVQFVHKLFTNKLELVYSNNS